jgi:DNA-binding MarR family transcriptional regulator
MRASKENTAETLPPIDLVEAAIDEWRRERPDLDPSSMRILARISRIEARKRESRERSFAKYGLNSGLFDVLARLLRSGAPYALTPTHLANSCMLTTGGMTGRLDKLEAAGLIQREPDHEDRRMLYIKLTTAGHDLISKVIEEHFANGERLLSGLSPSQREQFARLLAACERSVSAATELSPDGRDNEPPS